MTRRRHICVAWVDVLVPITIAVAPNGEYHWAPYVHYSNYTTFHRNFMFTYLYI